MTSTIFETFEDIEDCLTGLTGSSTQAGTNVTDFQLIGSSVADLAIMSCWSFSPPAAEYALAMICQF